MTIREAPPQPIAADFVLSMTLETAELFQALSTGAAGRRRLPALPVGSRQHICRTSYPRLLVGVSTQLPFRVAGGVFALALRSCCPRSFSLLS